MPVLETVQLDDHPIAQFLARHLPRLIALAAAVNLLSLSMVVMVLLSPGRYHYLPAVAASLSLVAGILLAAELYWMLKHRSRAVPHQPPEMLPVQVSAPRMATITDLIDELHTLQNLCRSATGFVMTFDSGPKQAERRAALTALLLLLERSAEELGGALRRSEQIGHHGKGSGIHQVQNAQRSLARVEVQLKEVSKNLKAARNKPCKRQFAVDNRHR